MTSDYLPQTIGTQGNQDGIEKNRLTLEHLERIRAFYEEQSAEPYAAGTGYRKLLARYYGYYIPADASILEIGCGNGELLSFLPNKDVVGIDIAEKPLEEARKRVPHGKFYRQAGEYLELDRTFDVIIVSETVNEAADVQALFAALHKVSRPDTRLVINYYNNLWRPVLGTLTGMGLKAKRPLMNWLSTGDLMNLLRLAEWEPVTHQPRILWPSTTPLLDGLFNRFIGPLPLIDHLNLTLFCLARPAKAKAQEPTASAPSVSVIIPARNEAGNIEAAIRRTPLMGSHTEIIFIEGGSKDNTWEVINQMPALFPDRDIKILKQTGKGKGNAVREAFAAAKGDILMILDGDLTMPPEELPKYYDALANGKAEFVNGVRLVYPMEDKAMQFLNMCANHAFSIIFTWLLGQRVRDTLCGTKVLYKRDYERIAANRSYFGDFDPFGDFDLLFGAAKLNLRIVDVPIRYRNRTYGETNISRWKHGVLLLRMVLFASIKMKFI